MNTKYLHKDLELIAGPTNIGDASPHIGVIIDLANNKGSVYYRSDFNAGGGSEKEKLYESEGGSFFRPDGEPSRGWKNIEVIVKDRIGSEANEIALAEAKRRNVILYRTKYDSSCTTEVVWHPENWTSFGNL